jgi:3-methyladenine DNA glycosylase AlkD
MLTQIQKDLKTHASPAQAKIFSRFFKTGKGEYGEGDIFLGIKVPNQRIIAKKHKNAALKDIEKLLHSKYHEHRLTALLILTYKYPKSEQKNKIINLYLKNTKYINNWDLVDLSAPKLLGDYLLDKPRDILYSLAKSKDLWEKRISILTTYTFIKNHEFQDTLKIAKILLHDEHDLIHKAIGWMLREIGKLDQTLEEKFLQKHLKSLPRTTLRYAIERFDEDLRQRYLKA